MTIITPYPLQWPQGVARTGAGKRIKSPFRTGYSKAVENVVRSLQGFQKDSGLRIDHPVLSSNVDLMGRLLDNDAGAAAWFMMDGQWVAFGVDRFNDTASNVQAIHHIIEARRVELRHGTLALVRASFTGFKALPAPPGSEWWDVLQVKRDSSLDVVRANFRRLASENHPDKGGTADKMATINEAWGRAQAALATRQ